ncbi:MAG: FecR domain-containing protein [Bacteroidetes bacterium]|nr:FecR domain-containing protein [Bacteroidota bacterium]
MVDKKLSELLKSYWEIDREKIFENFLVRKHQRMINRRAVIVTMKSLAAAMIVVAVATLGFFSWKAMRNSGASRSIVQLQVLKAMRQAALRPTLLLENNVTQYPDSTKSEETLGQLGNYTFQKRDTRHLSIEWTNKPVQNTTSDSIFSTFSIPANTGSWQLSLPDGSRILLDPGSSISLILHPFEPVMAQRSVTLQGSAVFKIASNAEIPFRVATSRWDLSVHGTLFSVRDFQEETSASTALYSGHLDVSSGGKFIQLPEQQRATVSTGNKDIQLSHETATLKDIPWKSDYFDFSRERLPVSLRRIADWYHLKDRVEYHGRLDTTGIGTFRAGTIEKGLPLSQFLDAVSTPDVRLSVKNENTLVVTGR